MEDQENWYDSIVGQKWPEHVMFVIEAQLMELHKDITVSFFANQLENKENNDPNLSWQGIGVIGLCYVDYIARSAELSIYIGSEEQQRKGYGTKAISLVKEWAFNQMNLRKIWVEAYDHVKPVHDFVKANGFKKVGTLPDSVFKDGAYRDSIYYAYYDTDWEKSGLEGKV